MKPVTLITGASSGIGTELARAFAAHGHELVLVARRADRLNALADDIAKAGHPRPQVLASDLSSATPWPRSPRSYNSSNSSRISSSTMPASA